MPNIYSAIDCSEVAWTVKESGGVGDTPSAEATLKVAWGNRWALINDIGANLRGWPHPGNLFGLPPLTASIEPAPVSSFTSSDQICVYTDAHVTIGYGVKETKVEKTESGTLYSESMEPIIEMLKQDHKLFTWINDSGVEVAAVLENEAPGRPTYSLKFRRSLIKRASIPAAVWACMGKCNVAAYTSVSLGITFEAQTLMLIPPKPKRTIKLDGSSSGFDIDLDFHWQPSGWNKFWHPTTNSYLRFATKAWDSSTSTTTLTPHTPVPTADFSGLWI